MYSMCKWYYRLGNTCNGVKMKKCYHKHFDYVIPKIHCGFCNKHIQTSEKIFSVVLEWGNGKTACEECYDQYEIDWSLHEIENEEGEI